MLRPWPADRRRRSRAGCRSSSPAPVFEVEPDELDRVGAGAGELLAGPRVGAEAEDPHHVSGWSTARAVCTWTRRGVAVPRGDGGTTTAVSASSARRATHATRRTACAAARRRSSGLRSSVAVWERLQVVAEDRPASLPVTGQQQPPLTVDPARGRVATVDDEHQVDRRGRTAETFASARAPRRTPSGGTARTEAVLGPSGLVGQQRPGRAGPRGAAPAVNGPNASRKSVRG